MSVNDSSVVLDEQNDEEPPLKGLGRLLYLIDNYCQLYARWRVNGLIHTPIYTTFLAIAHFYGFFDQAQDHLSIEKGGNLSWLSAQKVSQRKALFGITPVYDFSSALREISEHQKALSSAKWEYEFLIPFAKEDSDAPGLSVAQTWATLRLQHSLKIMVKLREGILLEDWPAVGRILGRMPAFSMVIKGVPRRVQNQLDGMSKRIAVALGPFYVPIFFAGVQRLMQHNVPRDVVAKSAAELMLQLVEGDYERDQLGRGLQPRNLGMFYAANLLIFCIANSLYQEAKDLIAAIESFPPIARKVQYITVIRGYTAALKYDQWRKNDESQEEMLNIADGLIGAIKDVPSGEERLFVDALIHFSLKLELPDMLLDVLTEACRKTPVLTGHCQRVLCFLDRRELAEELLYQVMTPSSEISASDPVWLEWVQLHLINSKKYEINDTMLPHFCVILCKFLDYGENRTDERAWGFLWTCLQRIEDPETILSLWEERRSWWPQFHRTVMGQASTDCRKRVFQFFGGYQ